MPRKALVGQNFRVWGPYVKKIGFKSWLRIADHLFVQITGAYDGDSVGDNQGYEEIHPCKFPMLSPRVCMWKNL